MYEIRSRNSILMMRTSQNQQISRIYRNFQKTPKSMKNDIPDTLKMKFRAANAANRVNRDPMVSRGKLSDS